MNRKRTSRPKPSSRTLTKIVESVVASLSYTPKRYSSRRVRSGKLSDAQLAPIGLAVVSRLNAFHDERAL